MKRIIAAVFIITICSSVSIFAQPRAIGVQQYGMFGTEVSYQHDLSPLCFVEVDAGVQTFKLPSDWIRTCHHPGEYASTSFNFVIMRKGRLDIFAGPGLIVGCLPQKVRYNYAPFPFPDPEPDEYGDGYSIIYGTDFSFYKRLPYGEGGKAYQNVISTLLTANIGVEWKFEHFELSLSLRPIFFSFDIAAGKKIEDHEGNKYDLPWEALKPYSQTYIFYTRLINSVFSSIGLRYAF